MFFISLIATLITVLWLFFIWKMITSKRPKLKGKHVLVTGGSSGIGKSVAIEALKRGASVSLIARNAEKLNHTKTEIQALISSKEQKVNCYPVDISKEFDNVSAVISQAENDLGPIYLLVNCAGTSISGRFEEQDIKEFEKMMNVNYFGTVNVTRAVIPSMKQRREGFVVFTSSLVGLTGLYGYTSYAASKFALRGLAECLHMEVKPYNIGITINFPPDTDTPGFAEEQKCKPEETRLISESAGLVSPDEVAKKLLVDTLDRKFFSVLGIEGSLIGIVCAGMSPVSSYLSLFTEIFFMGLCRLISSFYIIQFNGIVKKCMQQRDQNKKAC